MAHNMLSSFDVQNLCIRLKTDVSMEIYHELYISSTYDIHIYRCERENEVQYKYQVSPTHVGTPSFSIQYSYYMVERIPCTLSTSSSG